MRGSMVVINALHETNMWQIGQVAIQGISTIVTKTPLEDLERLAQLYNDSSAPLLDF